MKRIKYYRKIWKRFGRRALVFLFSSKIKRDPTQKIMVKEIKHSLSLSNFKEDVITLFQVFFAKEYEIKEVTCPKIIIDCGANIGLSAVYFANQYPAAKIYAIEPDKRNFCFLKENTKYYPNIVCLNYAVWSYTTTLEVVDVGNGSWALQTKETGSKTGIRSITITEILELARTKEIDLLKIDIEGAEKNLFSEGNYISWLERTKCLAIELHDFLDSEISTVFYKAITDFQFKRYQKGENLILIKSEE